MGTQKKMTSGSSEPQTFSSSLQVASSYQAISSNPFADLLNTDFHKENFNCYFKSLFPANMKLQIPVASTNNDS